MTRWPAYLVGRDLQATATLILQPEPGSELVLHVLCQSLKRLVSDAYQSVCSDAIGVFDQIRINTFLQRPRAADRPLMIKLQKGTWRQYMRIWKALLCFVYRTQHNDTSLGHRLTPQQLCNLDEAVKHANRHVQLYGATPTTNTQATVLLENSTDVLDYCCLELCISLLDHTLKGDVHESVVVGFLAVLGIDADKQTLKEAYYYTPSLSGFIKIAQMLVIQKALIKASDSDIS